MPPTADKDLISFPLIEGRDYIRDSHVFFFSSPYIVSAVFIFFRRNKVRRRTAEERLTSSSSPQFHLVLHAPCLAARFALIYIYAAK